MNRTTTKEPLRNYASMQLREDFFATISAEEYSYFDHFFERAKNGIEEEPDLEESDNTPYQIVYGSIFVEDKIERHKVFELINDMKGYALANVEEGEVHISGYDDIVYYDTGITNNRIPFAALMKTTLQINDLGRSVTYFPYTRKLIWEDIVNRDYLLAARKAVEYTGNKEDWVSHIDPKEWAYACNKSLIVDDEDSEEGTYAFSHCCCGCDVSQDNLEEKLALFIKMEKTERILERLNQKKTNN